MYKKKKIFCIILARKNSKGIKNKNLTIINNKHLIQYPIIAAKKSKHIDEVYFNTDCRKMATIAKKNGAIIDFIRPSKLAKSNSLSSEVIIHHIEKSKLDKKFDYLILLEPTSPLTNNVDIDKAIMKIINNNTATSLLCVTNHSIPNKNYICSLKKNFVNFHKTSKKFFRQDYEKNFFLTGNLYISKVNSYLKDKTFFQKKTTFLKVNFLKTIEIDNKEDLFLIRKILK